MKVAIFELSAEYAQFQVPCECWMTRSEREGLALVSRFFSTIGICKSNIVKPANCEEDQAMQVNVTSSSSTLLEKIQRPIQLTAEALNNPLDIILLSTLNNIFKKTEELLNIVGSITKVVSFEPSTRTV